jgi:hypothetical protein
MNKTFEDVEELLVHLPKETRALLRKIATIRGSEEETHPPSFSTNKSHQSKTASQLRLFPRFRFSIPCHLLSVIRHLPGF